MVSDDGTNTWTWDDRLLMSVDTNTFCSLSDRTADFKSMAAHEVQFEDLLFVHAPSNVTAEYAGVGDGTMDLGSHIDSIGELNCDYAMAGNGHPLTGGTLTLGGNMCDTDLYFNLGDHEIDLAYCLDYSGSWNHATYGPVWSHGNNNGCPFDDPSAHALPCQSLPIVHPGANSTEGSGMGFVSTQGFNSGATGSRPTTCRCTCADAWGRAGSARAPLLQEALDLFALQQTERQLDAAVADIDPVVVVQPRLKVRAATQTTVASSGALKEARWQVCTTQRSHTTTFPRRSCG